MSIHLILAGSLLAIVLLLILWRPFHLDVAWFAGGGALFALLTGLLSFPSLRDLIGSTWDATLTLVALFILAETLDRNGFFTWAALHLARIANGTGWKLYLFMLALTAGTTLLLANDGAVLMLTPVFATLLPTIYPSRRTWLPFLFATGFFADALSGLFIPGNLTNIILADAFHLSFGGLVRSLALPTLVAFLVGTGLFWLRFTRDVQTTYTTTNLADPAQVIRDRPVFIAGWVALCSLIVGYSLDPLTHAPVSLIAGLAAIGMLIMVRLRHLSGIRSLLKQAPWSILIYALGMFAVVTAAADAGVLDFVMIPIQSLVAMQSSLALFGLGSLFSAIAGIVNNLPATLIGVIALRHNVHAVQSIPAIIIGVDIGPKLTPFGSLATLLWLDILRRRQITISWEQYLRENWWVTLGVVLAALLVATIHW